MESTPTKLDEGKIEELVRPLRSVHAPTPDAAEKIQTEAAYFAKNATRLRYPDFRHQNLFVGFRRDRGWLQIRHRFPPETIRHVLACPWRKTCHFHVAHPLRPVP